MDSPLCPNFASESSMRPTVLLLGGWSPGPLPFLRSKLQSEGSCDIIEVPLRMPPFRGCWCLDLNFLVMCTVCLGPLWLLWQSFTHGKFFQGFLIFAGLSLWIRLIVAVVARAALAHGAELCLKEIRRRDVKMCIGFSWGAATLAELLTYKLDIRPAYLLMAPVSHCTAVASLREDAALRLQGQFDDNDLVHIIHASDDPIFCPHASRWEQTGATNLTLQDIHVFKSPSNKRKIADIMLTLLKSNNNIP